MGIINTKRRELPLSPFKRNFKGQTNILQLQNYSNYVPIDFIKGEIINYDTDIILNKLNFVENINRDTGEIETPTDKNGIERKEKRTAKYKNLIFSYYVESKRLIILGSLHTLWNDGKHNYNDFHLNAFNDVLNHLKSEFSIDAYQIKLLQLEWGYNIKPPMETNKIITGCMFHKWKPFDSKISSNKGKYYQAEHTKNYLIKIYNKGQQFKLKDEVLRIERKQLNYLAYALKNEIGQTLGDLINSDFKGLHDTLVKNWNEILFFDPIISDKERVIAYRDPLKWVSISTNQSRTTRSKKVKQVKQANQEKGGNIQNLLIDLMNHKQKEVSTH